MTKLHSLPVWRTRWCLLGKAFAWYSFVVYGASRDAGASGFGSLVVLSIIGQVKLLSMAPHDFKSTLIVISKVLPDEIYHLAGQTSVGLTFEQPSEPIDSIIIGMLNILEAMRFLNYRLNIITPVLVNVLVTLMEQESETNRCARREWIVTLTAMLKDRLNLYYTIKFAGIR